MEFIRQKIADFYLVVQKKGEGGARKMIKTMIKRSQGPVEPVAVEKLILLSEKDDQYQ